MANINLDFSDMSDPAFASLAGGVITDMTAAASTYASPIPTLAVLQTSLDEFIAAQYDSQGGSNAQKSIKNDKRLATEKLLKKLGAYVRLTADGDHTKLMLSGFPMSKVPQSKGPLPKPTLTVTPGPGSGTATLKSTAVDGADTYLFEYTTAPVTAQSAWTSISHSSSKLQVTGLASGQQYAFRVTPIGADPSRTPSDIITSYVL